MTTDYEEDVVEYVEWYDAVAHVGWRHKEEEIPIHLCKTIGFVVAEDCNFITIAGTFSEDSYNNSMTIPKAWITFRREVQDYVPLQDQRETS